MLNGFCSATTVFPAVTSRWGITRRRDPRTIFTRDIIASHRLHLPRSSWSWMLDLGEALLLVLIPWACWRLSPGSAAPTPAPVSAPAPALVPSPCSRSVAGKLASGIWLR